MPYITKRRIFYKIGRIVESVDVPLDKWAYISVKYWEFKEDKIKSYPINLGSVDFDINQIASTREVHIFEHEKGNDLSAPVLTEEQKQRNHEQFEKVRKTIFDKTRYQTEWVNPYKSGLKSLMTKDELSKCRIEFFDTLFDNREHEERAFWQYVLFLRNELADPRSWDRYEVIQKTRDVDLSQEAEQIFS